jgi:hypothetical protein
VLGRDFWLFELDSDQRPPEPPDVRVESVSLPPGEPGAA